MEKRSADLEKKNQLQDKITQSLASRVYKLEHHDLYSKIDKQVNEVVKEAVHNALHAPLCERFRDFSEFQMKEIPHDRMFESNSYISHPDHTTLYEALEASMQRDNNDELHKELTKSRKRRHDEQDPPPPPPKDSDRSKKKKHNFDVFASKQPPVQKSSAWKTSDSREAPSSSSKQNPASPSEQPVNDDPIPVNMHLLKSEDIGAAHLSKIKTRPDWLTPLPEEETPKRPKPDWIGKKKLVKAKFKCQAYKIVRPFHKNNISLQFQMEECHLLLTDHIDLINPEGNRVVHDMSKPLPLGGPPGQVTIQAQYFFNKDLEYLVSGNKERRHALSISKLKAAYYLDFGLKELVVSLWTESESDYDISSAYSISHWWFKRKEFYITRHSAPSDRNAVRSHMRILSVVSLKTFSRRADYKEYKISEADFKNLHPNDFEDLYLLNLQGKLNHLSGADKVALSTAVNLWTRNIVIRQSVEDLQLGIESYQTKLNIT
ncbi:hypothetical protein Tco_0301110 [Tanacetum coccineum]